MKRIKTKQEVEAYAFALDWYEDHRKVSKSLIKRLSLRYPYKGVAFRTSKENNFGPCTSWSKDKDSLQHYSIEDKVHKENIEGLDLEALCKDILFIDPRNSDLLDIIQVREVVKV
jgi:hypothetical protein